MCKNKKCQCTSGVCQVRVNKGGSGCWGMIIEWWRVDGLNGEVKELWSEIEKYFK